MNKKTIILLRFLLIMGTAAQVVTAICYAMNDTYAAEAVKYATAVYNGRAFVINAPVMSLTGLICRVIKIHPLIYVYNVLPIIEIPLAYGAYYYLFGRIFKDENDKILKYISCLILCVINIYGYWSGPLSSMSLLTGYFTGQGIMMHMVLPICAAFLMQKVPCIKADREMENISQSDDKDEYDEDYLEEWDMKKHPIINARNIAIALVILVIIQMASIFVLNSKINSLYDATLNLQNQLNEYVDASEE